MQFSVYGGLRFAFHLSLALAISSLAACDGEREERRDFSVPIPNAVIRTAPDASSAVLDPSITRPMFRFWGTGAFERERERDGTGTGASEGTALGTAEGTAQPSEVPHVETTPQSLAQLLHYQSLVVLGHVDTARLLADRHVDLTERRETGHVDLPRMVEGGIDAAFFGIWVDPEIDRGNDAFDAALAQIARVHEIDWASDDARVVARTADLVRAVELHQTAILLGVDGGHALGTDDEATALERLRQLRALGVRYLALTGAKDNVMGHSVLGEHPERGLTGLGEVIVTEMERLGMVVDLSYASEQTLNDVLDMATRPVVATRTGARALADRPRNLSDESIRRVAENKGVICVSFYPRLLDFDYHSHRLRIRQSSPEVFHTIRARGLPYTERGPAYREAALELDPTLEVPGPEIVIDHIMYIVAVGGAEVACLGGELDGISELPQGFDDAGDLPALTELLLERGLEAADIEMILGGNLIRVLTSGEVDPVQFTER